MKKYLLLLLIGLAPLVLGGEVQASFSLSGSTITQTGTDTNLSGLNGIAGISFTNTGVLNTYYTNSLNLIVNGTLTINPEEEKLSFGSNAPLDNIRINGTLNIGKELSFGGKTRYTKGVALATNRFGDCCSSGSIKIQNGGTLDVKGASLLLGGSVVVQTGSTFRVREGIFIERYQTRDTRIRFNNGVTSDVEGIECNGIWVNALGPLAKFDGYKPVLASGIEFQNVEYTLRNYDGTDAIDGYYTEEDGNSYGSAKINLINAKKGSDAALRVASQTQGTGVFEISKEIQFNVKSDTGVNIADAVVFSRDTNNGNRVNLNLRNGGATNYTNDRVYNNTTNALGNTPVFGVLTSVVRATTTHDRRSLNNNIDDNFLFSIWSYNHNLGQTTQSMKGDDALQVNWVLLPDTNITQSNKTTVDAYTEIDNLEKFYDRAKSYKLSHLEYPAINFQVVDPNGSQLNLGSKNLIIDNTAGSAFSVNEATHTITMKAGTMNCTGGKFSSLITTGTITFQNGASPGSCIFTDTNGTNGVLTLTGLEAANVLVYDDASAGDTTISYQTNQSGNLSVPFNATSSTDFQVVVRRQGYSESNFSFNPSPGGLFSFPIHQTRALTIEGTPIYQNGGNISKVTMDYVNKKINIGNFTIGAQEIYDTLQDLEVTELAMKNLRISNYDGHDKVLLLNGYQFRNRDGGASVPGINAFVFAAIGGVLDNSNGSVQFLANASATVDKQEQIIKMIEKIQGSAWNNTTEVYATPEAHLVNIVGTGFDPTTDSLSNIVQSMLNKGVLDVNTIKDLVE